MAKSIDFAEWYKRALCTIITILLTVIVSIASDMKGDLKIALYKTDTNKKQGEVNKEQIIINQIAIRTLKTTDLRYNKRLCIIEEVVQ